MFKYFIIKAREYIFIILTVTIFSLFNFSNSFSDENVFVVENVKVEGNVDLNFSRDKYINKAFLESFKILMSKILLTEDIIKLGNVDLNNIKFLINSFQIIEEKYNKDVYSINLKIFYNDTEVKKFLVKKNISFSEPKKISVLFFPVLFVNNNLRNLNENYFYNNWNQINIDNELINFILPIEDLDDILKIKEIKNNINEIDFEELTKKYNTNNYVIAVMDFQNEKLKIYLKTKFDNNKISKNINYELNNINDNESMSLILKKLKIKITDIWKSENLINLAIPLSIRVKFKYKKLNELNDFKKALFKMNIIENFSLEEFNINNSFFKIYYYGNPNKLTKELREFGYDLKNDQGKWKIDKYD